MPSIDDEQLVQRELALPPPIIPGKMPWLTMLPTFCIHARIRRARAPGALLEQVLAPRARLDDQVAARVERAHGP